MEEKIMPRALDSCLIVVGSSFLGAMLDIFCMNLARNSGPLSSPLIALAFQTAATGAFLALSSSVLEKRESPGSSFVALGAFVSSQTNLVNTLKKNISDWSFPVTPAVQSKSTDSHKSRNRDL